mmetsp:Transcript_3082/g.4757  ORF Transcript_3082/g.4757 Transcript_3082/m.4757 type:complete len:658 (-) Transcript_3082:67-2040(-)
MKISLDTPFLYQNRTTGSPSTTTLTCTQLCRLLCPPSSSSSTLLSLVNAATLVLGFDSISQSYDVNGWKVAGTVDVLKEACSEWYYEAVDASESSRRIEGPISTRALSKLYHLIVPADIDTSNNNSNDVVAGTTRVYRNEQEGWKQIDQLEDLQLAMEAFRETTIMPPLWSEQQMQQQRENHDCSKDDQQVSTEENSQNVTDELEAFLSSTDHLAPHATTSTTTKGDSSYINDDDDQEEYESDGGTRYIRDYQSGNWIHEALIKQQRATANANMNNNTVDSSSAGAGTSVDGNKSSLNDTTNANAATAATAAATAGTKNKRKRKKPKFSAKSARNWIYVTGLPLDTTEEELAQYFSKVGIIDIDPECLKPKIKLYRHKMTTTTTIRTTDTINGNGDDGKLLLGKLKGDASICYARPESVELALQILDENLFRDGAILSVQRAKFEQHGSSFDNNKDDKSSSFSSGGGGKGGKRRRVISESKRRVARLAAIQAVGWDESENGRIAGGLKGLRIIVLMNMFDPRELECDNDTDDDKDDGGVENNNDTRLRALEREVYTHCEEIGTVEKITIFSKHPAGVVIVKFVKPNDASDAVKAFNGKVRENGRKVEASFWDGLTDYTIVDTEKEEKEAEKRLDKFGDWLEEQELPEEFQLRVEGGD